MAKKVCKHCGATMVKYKHSLNTALIDGLKALEAFGGGANLASLNFTRNQWDNFQKLRYWELVEKTFNDDNKRVRGTWNITEKGKDFLAGNLKIKKSVLTYRGNAVKFLGKKVNIKTLLSKQYKQRQEYASDSLAAQEINAKENQNTNKRRNEEK